MRNMIARLIAVPIIAVFAVATNADAAKVAFIYSFQGGSNGGSDGVFPNPGLTNVGGVFYGTTYWGGAYGEGTVFSVTTEGVEKTTHSFGGSSDGSLPVSGLLYFGGQLYGSTMQGGGANCLSGCGTLFSISPGGAEKVIYSFQGDADGAGGASDLMRVGTTLFGTTPFGGGSGCTLGCGTVFSVTDGGAESVLYRFAGGGGDGAMPLSLTNSSGEQYGTTFDGGDDCGHGVGCGTIFSLSPAGAETVLYSFKGGSTDGYQPTGGLVDVGGIFYGLTGLGGASGCGAVYSVDESGIERIVYSFQCGTDGAYPAGNLLKIGNNYYGTTRGGRPHGFGTLFTVSTSGVEKVLYIFGGGHDGGTKPNGDLIFLKGALYGTTHNGGAVGIGTVFKAVF
jgi:uncharacterized repeat protein (TIGR03803 family)